MHPSRFLIKKNALTSLCLIDLWVVMSSPSAVPSLYLPSRLQLVCLCSNITMQCVGSQKSLLSCTPLFQAIDSIHQVGVYCLALVPANTLPKAPLGGVHVSEAKQRFLEGMLHPCNVLMCPHTCVTNLPKPRQKQPG